MEKKIISDVIEMTKGIPWKDVLVPLSQEDENLTPLPKVEYKIIESPTMDKLVRDVNAHLENGWVCDGWVQVSNGTSTRFYQSMERWVATEDVDNVIHIPGLEDEPDLYEDIEKDVDG